MVCACLDYSGEPGLNTWELVFIIFGSTLLLCLLILAAYWFYNRRKSNSHARQFVQDDSVCDPILSGNTIHDIIEMTTSGSGSGNNLTWFIKNKL